MAENQTEMPNPLDRTPEGIQRFKTHALGYLGLIEYDERLVPPQECPFDPSAATDADDEDRRARRHEGPDARPR